MCINYLLKQIYVCLQVYEIGETREVHHVACLLAYGANAIVPDLAQRTVEQLTSTEGLQGTVVDNVKTYTGLSSGKCH